ncbi:abc transporter b family protein [Lichtheimia corymbifera JMRC:FSU:9682]|uniref:Abc transporter b family protein n=1 Tax=Lichtheimia corymbifera JMRC:FSU:9682 TaxID=1263082 RepID=A0A068SAA8_9FUNG|nr:abc transporter b family protein [Lichtheimia corymbifera JMRC:FSU:9682]
MPSSNTSQSSETVHYQSTSIEKASIHSSTLDNNDTTPVHQSNNGKKKKVKQPTIPMHKLFRFATPLDRFMIAIACICSIIVGFLQPCSIAFFGAFVKQVMDSLDEGKSVSDATQPIVLVFVYLGTIILVLAYIANSLWVITGENQTRRIRTEFVHAVMRQDMGWYDQATEGSLTTRLATDAQLIQEGISEKFGSMIRALSAFVLGFVIAFVMGWNLAVIVLALLPLLAGSGGAMGYFVSKSTQNAQDAYAEAGHCAEQTFNGIRTVYSFSLQERFSRIYQEKLVKAREAGVRRGYILGAGVGGFLFVLFGMYAICFWYGGQLVIRDELEGWRVLVSYFCMLLGAMSLLQLPVQLSAISTACGAAHKIFSTIDRIPDIDPDSQDGLQPEKVVGEIQFRHVKFAYPTRPDIPVLKDFDLTIKPGMSVAFVGPSGSGKSTSIQLLQRFYDPLAGEILLDGNNIKDLNLSWLRKQIGVVSQEPVLFNMTIRQNLLLGVHHEVSDKDIVSACQKANCHSFITNLPDGYNTVVGEHGGMLSGGQKQRVAIARAILKNPSILLLDEATSALDTQSERLVQHALDAAAADRTTFVIAHRLSTIRNCDLICVMHQGDLVEKGTHQELLERNGVYAELVRKQEIATKQVGSTEQEDEEELLRKENAELLKQINKQNQVDQEKRQSLDLVRIGTATSIDAYELKLQREKQEMKARKKMNAPIGKILRQMRSEWPMMFVGCLGAVLSGAVFPAFAYTIARAIGSLVAKPEDVAPGPLEGGKYFHGYAMDTMI